MLGQFDSIPASVEAWQNIDHGCVPIPDWIDAEATNLTGGRFAIETRWGTRIAEMGDWIVRFGPGEAYPLTDGVFRHLFRIAKIG